MVGFVDRTLLELHAPAMLAGLLKGGAAPPYPRLRRLIATVFDDEGFADLEVVDVVVKKVTPMVRVAAADRLNGTFVTTQPAFSSSDIHGELRPAGGGEWAHLFASLRVSTMATLDVGGVDSAVVRSIEDIQSLADFASRFRYIDMPAFLAEHDITTVDELREAAHYLVAEVRFKAPPDLDPEDPARRHEVDVDVAIVLTDALDLAAGLAAAGRLRATGVTGPPGPNSPALGRAVSPFAVAVVFPRAALGPGEPTEAEVDSLYATGGVLPLFAGPP